MTCPFCGEDRLLERVGEQWVCAVCAKVWKALTENDRGFLKGIRVAAE